MPFYVAAAEPFHLARTKQRLVTVICCCGPTKTASRKTTHQKGRTERPQKIVQAREETKTTNLPSGNARDKLGFMFLISSQTNQKHRFQRSGYRFYYPSALARFYFLPGAIFICILPLISNITCPPVYIPKGVYYTGRTPFDHWSFLSRLSTSRYISQGGERL